LNEVAAAVKATLFRYSEDLRNPSPAFCLLKRRELPPLF
jgi:hypothetical protein